MPGTESASVRVNGYNDKDDNDSDDGDDMR